jgi:hypothetical protein
MKAITQFSALMLGLAGTFCFNPTQVLLAQYSDPTEYSGSVSIPVPHLVMYPLQQIQPIIKNSLQQMVQI